MATVYEDYTPMYCGDTGKPFTPYFQQVDADTGQLVPFPLTGITLSMVMQEQEKGTVKVCSGPWTIDDAPGGLAHYQWQAADVNTAGTWVVQVACTNSLGQIVRTDTKILEIKPVISLPS